MDRPSTLIWLEQWRCGPSPPPTTPLSQTIVSIVVVGSGGEEAGWVDGRADGRSGGGGTVVGGEGAGGGRWSGRHTKRGRLRLGSMSRLSNIGSDAVLGATGSGRRGDPNPVDLQRLGDQMMDVAIGAAIVIVVGLVIVVSIRAAGLHWSWPLLPLPALLAGGLIWPVPAAVAGGAALLAAGLGFLRHREQVERGGVEAQAARERSGPISLLRAERRARRWRVDRVCDGRLAVGQGADGQVRTVPFGARQGTRAFVLGAPGSGKTVTLLAHAVAYCERGLPVVCVDPKGDGSLADGLESAAASAGRRFYQWSSSGGATYNPLGRGAASEIADKALAGEEWSEPHYLRQAQRYLGLEVQALEAAGRWPATLASVVEHLNPDRLEALSDEAGETLGDAIRQYVDELSTRSRAELGGVRDRLAVLCESQLGPWLRPVEGAAEIELGRAMADGAVVYFQLDADRFPLASQMLGASIVVDLVGLTGELQGRALRGLVLIDEFAAVAADEIARLLSRSRSAGLTVVLATQAFADLSVARPGDSTESLRRQVLSHVDYVVAHRQSEPEAAELLAQMAGTKPAWARAERLGGASVWDTHSEVTRRRTREFVRHPDEFKVLGVGEAIVIEPAHAAGAHKVRVWPANSDALR